MDTLFKFLVLYGSFAVISCKRNEQVCSRQCDDRCFGKLPTQCCHSECVGGCTGPTNRECLACKNFNNDGVCVPYCPREYIYDPENYKYVPNPNAKYTYGTLCVDECPEHMVIKLGACFNDCGVDSIPDAVTRKCKRCEGVCPKSCEGNTGSEYIDAINIANYTGCTVIKNNIRILQTTFTGDPHIGKPPMDPSRLSVLKTVKEINGYLMVQGAHANFTSLAFLKNLETIHGRDRDNYGHALILYNTSATSLELNSALKVLSGDLVVGKNPKLCFTKQINWKHVTVSDRTQTRRVGKNKNETVCKSEGFICHPQCSSDGCWGKGEDNCLSCANFILNGRCLESCNQTMGMYTVNDTHCGMCNEECANMCSGPDANQCMGSCKNYRDGAYCKAKCPENKYPDSKNVCQPSHVNCTDGCTGSMVADNFIGFTAYISADYSTTASERVIFDSTYLNAGSGYSNETGHFTCPVTGYYTFSVTLNTRNNDYINLQLFRVTGPEAEVGYTVAHGHGLNFGSGSLLVVIQCLAGNTVYVKALQSSVLLGNYTSFSGYLLNLAA